MKETIVLALISFLAAVGGSTWYGAYLAPPRPEAASRPADTIKASAPVKRIDVAPDSATKVDSAPVRPLPLKGPSPVDLALRAERAKAVAKVIAAMKAKDAVAILSQLDEDEVERIARQLNPKQVAALLSAMPAAKAATLGRRLLEPAQRP